MAFSGVRDWKRGLAELLYSSAMWAGALVLIEVLVPWNRDRKVAETRLRVLALLLAVLGAAALLGGASSAVLFSAAPLISLAALLSGLRRPGARLRGPGGLRFSGSRPELPATLPHRRLRLRGTPPSLRVRGGRGAVARGSRGWRAPVRPAPVRERHRRRARGARGGRHRRARGALRGLGRRPIEGTGSFLSARPELAEEIGALARTIRRETGDGATLVVFPEGEILNSLSGRPNPIRHKLYIPGYLAAQNEAKVLGEPTRARPDAVVIWRRPTSEYGPSMFTLDYGRSIGEWIERDYAMGPFRPPGAPPRANPCSLTVSDAIARSSIADLR